MSLESSRGGRVLREAVLHIPIKWQRRAYQKEATDD